MQTRWPEEWTHTLRQSLEERLGSTTDWEAVKRKRRRLVRLRLGVAGGFAAAAGLALGVLLAVGGPGTINLEDSHRIATEWYSENLSTVYSDLDEIFGMTVALIEER